MFKHRHCDSHAVVQFSGDLTYPAAAELVDTVETLTSVYFYLLVEIVVASPGGAVSALEHYRDAQLRWRARGVRVRTRVVERASSAAALMLSLGDERIAEPGASLIYHLSRTPSDGLVTAADTVRMFASLSELDARYLSLLVDRAMADAGSVRRITADVEPSDLRVLEWLVNHLPTDAKRRPRRVRGLARMLERAVRRALRERDRPALTRIYNALCSSEMAISPAVALILRLVDRVGPLQAQGRCASGGAPGLTIPQWAALYPPAGEVPRDILTRHTLGVGDTGSGKSASVILPFVAASLAAPPGRVGGTLVIDPKRELGPVLERQAPERLHVLEPSRHGLDLMSGEWALADDLAAGRYLTAATCIATRVLGFDPSLPTRVLLEHQPSDLSSNAEYFERDGSALLLTVLAFVLMVTRPDAAAPEQWCPDTARGWVRGLLDRAHGSSGERGHNALALAAYVLDTGFTRDRSSSDFGFFSDDDSVVTAPVPFVVATRGAASVWGAEPGEARDVVDRVLGYWHDMVSEVPRQFAGVLSSARVACSAIAEPELATTLYFGCEPGATGTDSLARELAHAVSRDGPGRVYLYQPARSRRDALVGKIIKALFFETALSDPDRVRGGADLPLLGYVADEAHRFITSDPVHGEQSFLDTCRSFGVACVLACQSLASIEHALAQRGGSSVQNQSAVSIIWANTGSKFFFRSTDPRTSKYIDDICPVHPGLTRVTYVRPLSSLAPGECYAVLADGRFERRQLDPVLSVVPERGAARGRSRGGRRSRGTRGRLESKS